MSEEGYELFGNYCALKAHFNSNYNFHKQKGGVTASRSSFVDRDDAQYFTYLASVTKDPFNLLLSNIVNDPKVWIGDIEPDLENDIYKSWVRRNNSIRYTFENDLKALRDDFGSNFTVDKKGDYPYLLRAFVTRKISFETLSLMSGLFDLSSMKEAIEDPLYAPRMLHRADKYRPFIKYDKAEIVEALKNRWPHPSGERKI